MLPAITDKIQKRPGKVPASHFIPNDDSEFWNEFYAQVAQLTEPISDFKAKVNPYSGRYGYRWHPVAAKPRYFHIGIDVHADTGTPIAAIADGEFQYSGYAPLNGNYVVISHPQIVTADGFVLNSIYMHCDTVSHKFNLLQKIWRKFISIKPRWVNKYLKKGDKIATVGGTGVEGGYAPHLHLQFDFVSADGSKRVSVDPLKMFGETMSANLTAEIRDLEEFRTFYAAHKADLALWSKFIETYL